MTAKAPVDESIRPLKGRTIAVTRALEQADSMMARIDLLGGVAVSLPMIETTHVDSLEFDEMLDNLAVYDWIVFTSANAVRFVCERLEDVGRSVVDAFAHCNVAVVGRRTEAQLADRGVVADFVPGTADSESLVIGFASVELQGKKVFFPGSRIARSTVPVGLRRLGADVDVVSVYDVRRPESVSASAVDALLTGRVDAVAFASPSAVRNFRMLIPHELPREVTIACIGPVTAAAARSEGFEVAIVSTDRSGVGLIDSIADSFHREVDGIER